MAEDNKEFKLPEGEERILEFWEKHNIFEKSLQQTQKGKPFVFYDGPPFATGLPHYGHLLASTVKDVFGRYQTMEGRYVRRRWGWDCHGLPIEEIVERKLGISGKAQIEKIGIKTFNETCRSMVLQYVSDWKEVVEKIGRWVDFDNSYKTMDATFMESVWWGFKEIYKKGLVYEGRKVLMYCPRCETPVSNFEVAMDNSYKDVTEESVYVKFKVKHPEKIGLSGEVYLLAWTTTPWTLPGNVALAVGKDIKYDVFTLDSQEAVLYIAAQERMAAINTNTGSWTPSAKHQFKGSELVGLEYEPPFHVVSLKSEKSYRVYEADFVTTTDGTGIVHTAVVYGEDDYNLGMKVGLPVVPMLNERGIFNDEAPEFLRGQYFKKGDALIIDALEKHNQLFKKEKYTHSYPHCWRCGTALYYSAIPAWFVNVQKIKSKLLKSNDREINWYPEYLKHGRYEKSVEAAPDWNISRNRYWGNPIPAWKCDKCKKEEIIGSLDELAEKAKKTKNNYWVMRHGQAETNVFNITDSGQGEYHLTDKGREQAKHSADTFKKKLAKDKKKIDLIISSNILRTKETAGIAKEELGVSDIVYDDRLWEINLGPNLSGCHDTKYHTLFPTYQDRFERRPDGGESLRDLRKRMWDFLKDCESKYEGKNILLVSHEYPIWMLFTLSEAWDEKKSIAEKEQEGENGYVDFAENRKLDIKTLPRNDDGLVDMHRPYIDEVRLVCDSCDGHMTRTPEIFDSWVEAGSMPFAEYHYPFENKAVFEKAYPADFIAEYIAQTRAWFYVMHVVCFNVFGEAPFRNAVTTGTILAEDGSKMSKSKNNFPDPKILLSKYGADSLRFYLMNSVVMQAENLNFSEKGVESVYRKVELILSNVYKYFATYVGLENGSKESSNQAGSDLLDSWITLRTEELVSEVTENLNAYDTVHATRVIQEYVDDLSTWYLRRSRKRDDREFFNILHNSLLTTSKIIAPFMPFLADDLYRKIKSHGISLEKAESVHLSEWPETEFSLKESKRNELKEAMAEVRRISSLGLSKREEAKINVRQPLPKLTVASKLSLNVGFVEILKDEVNVKEVIFDASLPEGSEVVLDTNITPELKGEGLVREVTRLVQGLRRDAGLVPADSIMLYIQSTPEVWNAIERHSASFKFEVGAKEVLSEKSDKFSAEKKTDLDGQPIWLGVRKV